MRFPDLVVVAEVTKEDIENGLSHSCFRCPVALALRRVVPSLSPDVGASLIRLHDGQNLWRYYEARTVPAEVKRFISAFDSNSTARRSKLSPFTFTLEFKQHIKVV